MKYRLFIYFLTYLFVWLCCMLDCRAYERTENAGGLGFRSNKVPIPERTTYSVFSHPRNLPREDLEISFDLSLYGTFKIGHILTCKNGQEVFNLIVRNVDNYDSLLLNFNVTALNRKLVLAIPKSECRPNSWHDFSLGISPGAAEIRMSVDGRETSTSFDPNDFPKGKVRYVFGKCDHYVDVFDFAIKDLIHSEDGRRVCFPLDEREGNPVYDDKGKRCGWVENPDWLIMSHYKWEKLYQIKEDEIAAVFLDTVTHVLNIHTSDNDYGLFLKDNRLSSVKTPQTDGFRLMKGGGCNYVWMENRKELVLFNCLRSKPDDWTIAVYGWADRNLRLSGRSDLSSKLHHNSAFPDKSGRGLYLFGGYGSFMYSNAFHYLDFDTFEWTDLTFEGDYIEPRFYSAVATDYRGGEETVYLFGGHGNISGHQDDGSRYFHDLYRVNPKDRTVEELYDFRMDGFDMVPARDIILGEDGHSFYTLCFRQYKPKSFIRLYRFDWKTGECIPVSDSIQFTSQKISTQVHLFKESYTRSLIGVIQEFTDPESSTIKIYKLSGPLLTESFSENGESDLMRYFIFFSIIVLLAISCCVYVFFTRSGKRRRQKILSSDTQPEALNDEEEPESGTLRPNSIYLLGGFMAINRSGRDVSYMFSSKIRQLFLLILLHTLRENSNGITPTEVSSILWPDKDAVKSRNIRGVTIKNLKTVLSEIDGVSIVNSGGKWSLEYDKDRFFCDYIHILSAGKDWNVGDYATIRPDVRLLRRGMLLEGEEFEWLDAFKAEYEERILETWTPVVHEAFDRGSYMVSYKLSQVLLTIDRFGEELLRIEVRSLINLGDPVKAKMKFRHFSLEYYEAYGKSLSFEDFT